MMFGGYEDRRTPAERDRDLQRADMREANIQLSLGFLKQLKPFLVESGAEVGLPGRGEYAGAELLIVSDNVTYKIGVRVDHD